MSDYEKSSECYTRSSELNAPIFQTFIFKFTSVIEPSVLVDLANKNTGLLVKYEFQIK